MNIQSSIRKILTEWPAEKSNPFKENQLANFIRDNFKKEIEGIVFKVADSYKIIGSAGAGNWANIPWLSILDPGITTSTQNGVYPVYLFRADGSGAYLSLNQGTTTPKNSYGKKGALIEAGKIKNFFLQHLAFEDGWSVDSLDLKATTTLGKGYEEPSIISKFYDANALPSEDILVADLSEMLEIYVNVSTLWPFLNEEDILAGIEEKPVVGKETLLNVSSFTRDIKYANLHYHTDLPIRFIAALLTKPFVILTGLSGSGKTKLAEAFSLWITESKDQYCMVSVGADWVNREPLLGFPNALVEGEYVKPDNDALDLILRAKENPEQPYFLILDEMNMSHVERYFADFLSAMESTDRIISLHPDSSEWKVEAEGGVPPEFKLPENLFIVGTVNIDETTYMFSPKVLDRANVIEFRVSEDEMNAYLETSMRLDMESLRGKGASMGKGFIAKALEDVDPPENLKEKILPFFTELQKLGAEFGYRTASEIGRFAAVCADIAGDKMTEAEIVDAAIMQKLLPKVHGSRSRIEKTLKALGSLCLENSDDDPFKRVNKGEEPPGLKYPLSHEKLMRMHRRLIADGFTSYAEA